MNDLLEEYKKRFGYYPPKLMCTNYKNEIYQELMKQALEDDIPITGEDVEEAFEGIGIDIVKK